MGVAAPSDMSATFARLFNARDTQGLLGLYSEDAVLTIDGAEIARGHAAIAAMMGPMMDGPLKLDARCGACHENGDTAVVRTDWVLRGPDGAAAMTGASAEVLRRGGDGRWRFVIDDATFSSRAAA
ncbi:MAG: SgcJ/EcaC family oxidoreductase [Rhodospirillaceae bacterium]|nr:SgcJ/EcaC family oxidoreductase [Rhodospirillaceae bacterium]